jgi:metal-responsive CopG/Arc/MetJ family transcriptional regulator
MLACKHPSVQLCYTEFMESTKKTAVSLPRALADRAERAARRRGMPRSRLYALALEAFLVDEQETDEELTAQINAVLATEADLVEDKALDAWLAEAGRRTWDSVEWKE